MQEFSAESILQKTGVHTEIAELCFSFFVLYSRFEYALKRSGFKKKKEAVEVCLDSAGNTLNARCEEQIRKARLNKLYIFCHPPKKQINKGEDFGWIESNTESMNETRRALHLASTVRNNLFHGGKWPDGPEYDVARDEKLIRGAIELVTIILNSVPELKEKFTAFP